MCRRFYMDFIDIVIITITACIQHFLGTPFFLRHYTTVNFDKISNQTYQLMYILKHKTCLFPREMYHLS